MKGNAQHKIRVGNKLRKTLIVGAVALILGTVPGTPHPAQAGFNEGRAALKQGNYEVAWQEFLPLAEAGITAAQCRIAEMLRDGLGVRRDLPAAATWFQRAAEMGMARAQFSLANMYWRGRGIERSEAEAHRLFKAAFGEVLLEAEAGNVGQKLALARMYRFGLGVDQDLGLAAQWYARAAAVLAPAARAGHASSAIKLARIYIDGIGLPKDYGAAMELYRIAAGTGDAAAQFSLGKLLFNGIGDVPRQPASAIPYLIQAAENGVPRAQVLLGLAYARGKGVAKDHVEAFKWLRLAQAQGVPNATPLLQDILPGMTDAQKDDGRQKVRLWQDAFAGERSDTEARRLQRRGRA